MSAPIATVRSGSAVALKYLSLIFACVVVVLPMVAVLMTALKTSEGKSRPASALSPPHNWLNYHNFVTAFTRATCCKVFSTPASCWCSLLRAQC